LSQYCFKTLLKCKLTRHRTMMLAKTIAYQAAILLGKLLCNSSRWKMKAAVKYTAARILERRCAL
jgi:hypothetical protein